MRLQKIIIVSTTHQSVGNILSIAPMCLFHFCYDKTSTKHDFNRSA